MGILRRGAGWLLLLLIGLGGGANGAREARPERLLADDSLLEAPQRLPLVPARTSTIHRARIGHSQFNLHSYIAYFDGKYWVIWSSSPINEDSPGQSIRYSTSRDGHRWEESRILAADPDGPEHPGRWIARGIFVQGGRLQALCAYQEGSRETPQGEETWSKLKLVRFEWSGKAWENRGTYLDNCMNNYPPRLLDGRLVMSCRDSYARMHTARSETADGSRWKVTRLPGEPPGDRMSEPSWYVDPEGIAHMIFRDARRSHYLYRALSRDGGRSWSSPVRTNYPDATSKNLTGRLSNGWYYLINNPNQQGRDPLSISFSRDGWTFAQPRALRSGAPEIRIPRRGRDRGFQYPHALERDGSFWVVYSMNQEDIEISEFKISDFGLEGSSGQ